MRKSSVFGVSLGGLLTAACATAPQTITLTTAFDPSEVAWAERTGTNAIKGRANLRTGGGDVKTCAGLRVGVIPVSSYTSEWMEKMFGSTVSGYVTSPPKVTLDLAAVATAKETVCDPTGEFIFTDLPDGEYFVLLSVTSGGVTLMQRVALEGGEIKSITLRA